MDLDLFFFSQVAVNGLVLGLFYAVIGMGLTVVFGVIHVLNFAYGETYMLGAYVLYYLYTTGVNYFASAVISMMAIALFSALLFYLFFRHFRGRLLASYILSLGLLFGLQAAAMLGFGIKPKGVISPLQGNLTLLGAVISEHKLFVVPVFLAIIIGTFFFVQRTKWGRAMSCVQQDEEAAILQGMSPSFASYLAMAVAGIIAGAGGALIAPIFIIEPTMGINPLIKGLIVMCMAGAGSIPGALVVGLSLGLVESVISMYDVPLATIVSFCLLVIVLLVRPTGFWGRPL